MTSQTCSSLYPWLLAAWAAAHGVAAQMQGLKGEYFADRSLQDLRLTRVDPRLDFDWGLSAPAPDLPEDNFSVRWTGRLEAPESQPFTFYLRSDDGARLWLDDRLLIDSWFPRADGEDSVTVALEKGRQYDLRVEYFEATGVARVQLSWSNPQRPRQVIPPEFLSPPPEPAGAIGAASASPQSTVSDPPIPRGPVRLAHGALAPGEVERVLPEGVEVRTARGPQVIPWEALSWGTRFRYQPAFREHFAKVLAGEPIDWTATEPVPPATASRPPSPPPTGQAPPAASAPQQPQASTPVSPVPIRESAFKNPRDVLVAAIGFGSEPSEIIYVAAELVSQPGVRPERLFWVTGAHAPEAPPQSIAPARGNPLLFEGIRWTGRRGDYEIEAVVDVLCLTGHPRGFAATVRMEAKKGPTRIRYLLRSPQLPTGTFAKAPNVATVFQTPTLQARVTGGGRKLIAAVKVGPWDILPLSGPVDQQLNFEIFDNRGKSVERGRIRADEAVLRSKSEIWETEFRRLKGGEDYVLKLAMNLGDLFGVATAEQRISVVDIR